MNQKNLDAHIVVSIMSNGSPSLNISNSLLIRSVNKNSKQDNNAPKILDAHIVKQGNVPNHAHMVISIVLNISWFVLHTLLETRNSRRTHCIASLSRLTSQRHWFVEMNQSSSSPTKILEMHKYYMYWNIEKKKSRRAHCIGSSSPMTILEMHKY